MNNNDFVYVDIPLVIGDLTYEYGLASKSVGQILFEIGALKDSEKYESYEDMKNNYPEEYIYIDSLKATKIPIAVIHATSSIDSSLKYTQYLLISNLCNGYRIEVAYDDNLTCYCASEKLVTYPEAYPGITIANDRRVYYNSGEI